MSDWGKHPGYPVNNESGIVQEMHETNRLLREMSRSLREIVRALKSETHHDNVLGGSVARTGDTMFPIQPGNTPVFQVTPTFSGAAFTTVAANASVTSSDTTNFPVELVPGDATGLTFQAPIPATATPVAGSETITITWTYTNTDGTVATVTGTVTETGIVADDVTGGTFAQIQ